MANAASGLSADLGSLPMADPAERSRWRVGGIEPEVVVFPRSVDELAEVMGRASEEGWSVLPAGGGGWLAGGGLPARVDVVVSTRELRNVVEYVPDDLTLTAEAGVDLETLSRTSRDHGQWLAQDPPGWHGATLGAFVSTGLPGPLVAGFGRPRDHLLGLTAVTGDGRILRPGGKVVKNVAGYDLVRLLAGSWGTLAVIASATVRLYPLSRRDVTLLFGGDDPFRLADAARALATASVVPESLELVWGSSEGARGGSRKGSARASSMLVARILGSPEEVDEKERILRTATPDFEPIRIVGKESRSFHDGLAAEVGGGTRSVSLRLGALPTRLEELLEVAVDLGRRVRDEGARVWTSASVTRGTLRMEIDPDGSLREGSWSPEAWGPLIESARGCVSRLGGSLTIVRGSRDLLEAVETRGPDDGTRSLMEGVRREMDPAGALVPGRMELGEDPMVDRRGAR